MAEEYVKGLVIKRLKELGYPENQDTKINGVIWYKEDSYELLDSYISSCFKKATKSLTKENKGTPDFVITTDSDDLIIVIECKDSVQYHQTHNNLYEYKNSLGSKFDVKNYCINGALHYALFANNYHDVIAIAISGSEEENIRFTSYVLPKRSGLEDIILLENNNLDKCLMTISEYKSEINKKLGRNQLENETILNNLSLYASSCANYLRANNISANDRAGFISAIVLALTNENSSLYKNTKEAIDKTLKKQTTIFKDLIDDQAITQLKSSLEDIWKEQDKLPPTKREPLEEYYDKLLTQSLLNNPEGKDTKYFKYGSNILSCCIYSIYENIISVLKNHRDLDIMGTFYTVFLKYTKGDAKDKGIVLTPKHITELFCDLAEHFLGQPLDENVKILDICCGTGGFLIAALNRMDYNIERLNISRKEKEAKKEIARKRCLVGVEFDKEMFALSYANMRFHGDGKSNLYSCSSLLKHKYPKSNKGLAAKDRFSQKPVSLEEELSKEYFYDEKDNILKVDKRFIDIGMINPPYSLISNNKEKKKEQEGQQELDFVNSMLHYLKKGGIGIAIVPMACGSEKGKSLRKNILNNHTLLACMSMPKQLFQNSRVGTTTCIMIFKAHIPHKDSNKNVFMSRWLNDGFISVPHKGRYDKNNLWFTHKQKWLEQLQPNANLDNTTSLYKKLSESQECLAEAYVQTKWDSIYENNFTEQLKKYILYKHCCNNGLELDDKNMLMYLLDNLEVFAKQYKPSILSKILKLDIDYWETINIKQIFELDKGIYYPNNCYTSGETPLVTACETNNGIMKYTNLDAKFKGNQITIGKVKMSAFYQECPFCCSHDVTVLTSKYEGFNKYIAMFIIGLMSMEKYRWDYGRQIQKKATGTTNLKMPVLLNEVNKPILDQKGNYIPDYEFMENYIKSLPYSKSI